MKTFNQFISEVKKPTGDLKKACWDGYTAVGMKDKGGRKVPNCVPEEVEIEEGESMHHKLVYAISSRMKDTPQPRRAPKDAAEAESWARMERDKAALHGIAAKNAAQKEKERLAKEEVELDETAAWQRKEGKNPEGGLNQKGVDSYRKEHPGSKLKTAVTTKPSKLDPDSKSAKRRKSFCARMSGMKKRLTSAKTAHDPDSRINKSLRKWNC